jgi:hypothetical protein
MINLFKSKPVRVLIAILLIAIPITLCLLPVDYFDHGQATCLSVIFFDMECYGCGMTRAVMRMMHFDITGAYKFNPLIIPVFPLLALIWLKLFLLIVFNIKILKGF